MGHGGMSNNWEQRIQRRLVKPVGVINTQQLHCHYQTTQERAGRLIQRVALPEQVKIRYGSGVLQPTAMLQNLQRHGRESVNDFEGQYGAYPWSGYAITPHHQLPASPVSGTMVQRSMQLQSRQFKNSGETKRSNNLQQSITQKATAMTKPWVEQIPKSNISSSFGQTSREIGEPASRGGTNQQLRIDRQAAISEVNALSVNKSYSVQRQIDTHLNSNPTVTPTQLETSGALPPPSPKKSQILRISRQARIAAVDDKNPSTRNEGESKSPKSQDLPLTKATSQLSASTAQTKADASDAVIQAKIQANKSPLEIIESQKALNLNQSGNPRIGVQAQSSQQPNLNLPFAQAVNQLSASTVQTKADTSVNANSLETEVGSTNQPKTNSPVIKGIIQTKRAAAKSSATFSTKSIGARTSHYQFLPLALQGKQANLPVQLSPASIAVNPTVVSPKPSQLTHSSELPQVWLKSSGDLPTTEKRSTPTTYSQKMSLPLAKAPISINNINRAIAKQLPEGQVARQTNTVTNSTVQLAMSGNSLTQMSSPETASVSPMDLTQVAEQVSRILTRQLSVERERRGIGRW